ncbi:MAG: oligopeptide:H+ symporter [Stappiaceae bacterium]
MSQTTTTKLAGPGSKKIWSPGILTLFVVQAFDRAGFYALLAVLVLFLIDNRAIPTADAYILVGTFTSLIALAGVGGGILADKVLGRGRAMAAGYVLAGIGAVLLTVPAQTAFDLGLGMIAIGTGLVRSNLPPLLGALVGENEERQTASFHTLYLATNLGGTIGPIAISLVTLAVGHSAGFLLVSAMYVCSLSFYLFGRKWLEGHDRPPQSIASKNKTQPFNAGYRPFAVTAGLCLVALVCATFVLNHPELVGWCVLAAFLAVLILYARLLRVQDKQGRSQVLAHMVVVVVSIAFLAISEQLSLSVLIFTQQDVDRVLFDWNVPTPAFNGLNSAFVVLIGPLVIVVLRYLAKRNREPDDFFKLGIGCLIAGVSFELLRLGVRITGPDALVPLFWLLLFQAVLVCGEMLVGPIGLKLANQLSLPGMNGFFIGVFYLAGAGAGYAAGMLAADTTVGADSSMNDFSFGFSVFGLLGLTIGLLTITARFVRLRNRHH